MWFYLKHQVCQGPDCLPLTFRFTLAVKTSASAIAGTNQSVAQVGPFPLLIYLIVLPIVKTASCEELQGRLEQFHPSSFSPTKLLNFAN